MQTLQKVQPINELPKPYMAHLLQEVKRPLEEKKRNETYSRLIALAELVDIMEDSD